MIEIFYSFEPIEIRPIIAAKKVKDVKIVFIDYIVNPILCS